MKTFGRIDPEAVEAFLDWLSPDREEAARQFQELQTKLVRFLERGGCHVADDIFYESVVRSGCKVLRGEVMRSVNPHHYCTGVARFVLKEYRRDVKPEPLPPDPPFQPREPEFSEREMACLDGCLKKLNDHARDLVTRWHRHEGRARIEDHKKMAAEEGGENALRVKVFRIKKTLRGCVSECLELGGNASQNSGLT